MNTATPMEYSADTFGATGLDYLTTSLVSLEPDEGSELNPMEPDEIEFDKTLATDISLASGPPFEPIKGGFKLLQLWEGRIVEVRNAEFDAIIVDKTNPDFIDELVILDIEEISPDDLPLLRIGSVFYWSIGYLDYPGRGRTRESKIRFRRLRGWSEKEINESKRVGKRFAEFFKSNPVRSPRT